MVLVGTHDNGLVDEPAVFDMYLESEGKFLVIKHLGDLEHALRRSPK
jgi:hypothetical protein